MQKIINTIALLSGLVCLGVIAGGSYLYLNKDAMIEDVRVKVTEEITNAITDALPGIVDSAIPELPSTTGEVIPSSPNFTGGAVPF
jgi:hypothetical protein